MKNVSLVFNLIFTLVIIVLAFLLAKQENTQKKNTEQILSFIDSIDRSNSIYFSKLDSLSLIKQKEYYTYKKITLKYDTIQIAIDTMPNISATKYLLTISRQLTAKGIE